MNGITVFPRIIAGGDYSREGNYSREVIISILLTGSCALNVCFIFPLNQKYFTREIFFNNRRGISYLHAAM